MYNSRIEPIVPDSHDIYQSRSDGLSTSPVMPYRPALIIIYVESSPLT